MSSIEDINHLLHSISRIVKENVSCEYQLFLFGSRATVTNDIKADIDIGIIPNKKLSARQLQNIKENIEELSTLLKIDFIDFSSVSDEFKSIALMNTRDIIFD